MAGGWRVTARMVATAVAAKAVTRAAESVRKLLDEAAPQAQLAAAPAAPEPYPPVAHLTATAGLHPAPSSEDRVIAAQVVPPHEFGPIPLVAPSHGIGFRSEPRRRQPAGEMPVISRPPSEEPGGRKDVAPAAPVILPKSVTTAAAFVQDLDDTDDDGEPPVDALDEAPPAEPDAAPEAVAEAEPVAQEEDEAEDVAEPVADVPDEPVVEPVAEEPVAEPEPEPEPVRTLRLTDPPYDDAPISPEPAPVVDEPVEPLAVVPEPAVIEEPASSRYSFGKPGKAKGKHRRRTSAISGTVQSSRGRGLRGIRVTALDDQDNVVGSAVSGAGGAFVVEDLPAGSYRLTASDEARGDFAMGPDPDADTIKVKHAKTRRNAGVTLVAASVVSLAVEMRKKKAVVEVTVTERATGIRAKGSVRVTTKRFAAELPLSKGRTAVTLIGSADGSPKLAKKIKVDYRGTRHVLPGSATVRLR
ncbi:carboxypeptidase-like regulatory domain-containing protein [Aeromicrobium sp. 9AM]|uniref:carboxypeptidase-like regulatory domain-containing protein n=1 Tax=Aeromicrobium sp. 9AM TaxID=2653126 RepID=UPI0012F12156|nr:carboxypeptidase-like regulatory domain-containing protein [Aeromicrobium sp. 9AM]VXC45523.1 conserved hypothetical protein [Aeromicrobium sp. 9AM]